MKIALIGASGLVGKEIIRQLTEQPELTELTLILRRPLGYYQNIKTKELLINDFNNLRAELEGKLFADVFICALGTTMKTAGGKESFRKVDYDFVVEFARIAQNNGVQKLIIVSAKGANPESIFFYNRIKGEMEKAVRNEFSRHLIFLRPGLLVGLERTENRFGERLSVQLYEFIKPILPSSLNKELATDVLELANKIVQDAIQSKNDQ